MKEPDIAGGEGIYRQRHLLGTSGPLNLPCVNDDIPAGTTDSRREFQVALGPPLTVFVRVLDFRGDARPDSIYTVTVAGVNWETSGSRKSARPGWWTGVPAVRATYRPVSRRLC